MNTIAYAALIVSSLSLLVALGSFAFNYYAARRRATFEMLREIENRPCGTYGHKVPALQAQVKEHYRDEKSLRPEGMAMMQTLNGVELLALMRKKGDADKNIADDFVENLLDLAPPEVIEELRLCCEDEKAYSDLLEYFRELQTKRNKVTKP